MRIGIDGSCWANRRGFGRFTRCLVTEMAARADGDELFLLLDAASAGDTSTPPIPDGVTLATASVGTTPITAPASGGRAPVDLLRLGAAARRMRCDAFFFPTTYSYFPVLTTPVVVTVHDAIAERLPDLTLPTRSDRVRWGIKQRVALLEAREVLTVSEASRDAILESLPVRGEHLHVIREAPASIFRHQGPEARRPALARLGLDDGGSFLLYVGGISPHKNLEVLITAFELVADAYSDLRLVLVGDLDDDPFLSSTASVRAAVEASRFRDRIRLTGYVTDDELVALYSGALASALPSLGEGYGLTAAESAACHTPVVSSRDPALIELLGDAALFADAADPSAFASHFRALLAEPDLRNRLSDASARRAAEWSWGAAAEVTIGLLHRVARRRG